MEKKIVVPEGMLRAAWHAQLPADNPTFEWDEGDELNRKFYRRIFEAALRWLSENPIVPTLEQTESMRHLFHITDKPLSVYQNVAVEWQRRCFLAPEPEVPEDVKELLWADARCPDGIFYFPVDDRKPYTSETLHHNEQIIEAYRRGKGAK